jgi:intracellular multiplication protein IcmX
MKHIIKFATVSLGLLISATAVGQDTEKLEKYIQNIGSYYGIDVENDDYANLVKQTDIFENDTTNWLDLAKKARSSLLGLMPELIDYLPAQQTSSRFAGLRSQESQQRRTNSFLPTSNTAAPLSINSLLDKDPTQDNPTAQAIANIVIPPYVSGKQCINCKTADSLLTTTGSLSRPSDEDYVVKSITDRNLAEIAQLNLNSLLDPVVYSISRGEPGTGSPSTRKSSPLAGALSPDSEEATAANFVRYVTNQVKNLDYPQKFEFNTAYSKAIEAINDKSSSPEATKLAKYIANLRSYAAQASVGISNFNYLLAKRKLNGDSGVSQAAIEAEMATKELFNPQWYTDMEQSSDSVVQRQTLYMLAKMNYQLYLNRLMYERILATLSVMQLQDLDQATHSLTLSGDDVEVE